MGATNDPANGYLVLVSKQIINNSDRKMRKSTLEAEDGTFHSLGTLVLVHHLNWIVVNHISGDQFVHDGQILLSPPLFNVTSHDGHVLFCCHRKYSFVCCFLSRM